MDTTLLIIRVIFGLAMAAHGAQKLLGWFGGYGIKATGNFFEKIGFRPGVPFAIAAGLSELGGGVLIALGLLTPFGAAAVLSAMLVAMISVHVKNGFFASTNGIELPFLYAVASVAVGWTGAGAFSLDRLLRLDLLFPSYTAITLLLLAVVGASATLGLRDTGSSDKTEPSLSQSVKTVNLRD
jgi:putative oxidoreductase